MTGPPPLRCTYNTESSFVHTTLRFTPEEKAKRHPCAYMPFGYGPRNCIGMRFALLEAKMALIEIVSKFRIVLAPETKVRLVAHANKVVTCRALAIAAIQHSIIRMYACHVQ